MQDDALDVESNITTTGKIKHRQYFNKKNPNNEVGYSNKNKSK